MAMVLGMFMAILDIQIVCASISDIQAGLAASPDEASWVQTSYLIAEIVMIPLSGWLSRLLSTRVLFVASALGFTLFSLACAGASSLGEMVVFRAAQGFIGGAMIPTVFATTFLLFPGEKRTQMSVLIGLTATMAPTIGPTLGGWLTEQYSWHWLFLINVPVGLVVAGAVWTCLDIDKPDWSLRRSFDLLGLLLMALFLGALEYVLEEGDRWDWFQDETIAWCRRDLRGRRRAVLLAHADAARSAGGAARLRQRQLRVRLAVQLRAWPRAVWLGVSGAVVPRPRARLRQPADRRDDVRDRGWRCSCRRRSPDSSRG